MAQFEEELAREIGDLVRHHVEKQVNEVRADNWHWRKKRPGKWLGIHKRDAICNDQTSLESQRLE
jgi:hypothetical protein